MNCQRCGTINDDSAKFCRSCGDALVRKNIMDEYPALKLMPTSIAKPKIRIRYTIGYYLFGLISVALLITCIGFYFVNLSEGLYRYHGAAEVFFVMLIALAISSLFTLSFHLKRKVSLPKEIEYVSMNPRLRRYPFVVANNKFGVFDMVEKRLAIPCEYDYLSWAKPGTILDAHHPQNGLIKIDISNHQLK